VTATTITKRPVVSAEISAGISQRQAKARAGASERALLTLSPSYTSALALPLRLQPLSQTDREPRACTSLFYEEVPRCVCVRPRLYIMHTRILYFRTIFFSLSIISFTSTRVKGMKNNKVSCNSYQRGDKIVK
jgi:hypothetical protein